jgi:hypothetical protein
LHVHGGTGNLNYVSNVVRHKSVLGCQLALGL